MLLKITPYFLIIVSLIGFFVDPGPIPVTSNGKTHVIAILAYLLFTLPWWQKSLAILVGVLWIYFRRKLKSNTEDLNNMENSSL
jgi:hypothetical protein